MEGHVHRTLEVEGREAYVVVDRWIDDLAAGGLRYSPSVTLGELERLAETMTLKWSALDLPFGGCKLGIRGDPGSPDKPSVLRAFAQAAGSTLRDRIVTGPDLGTSFADMKVFFEAMGQDSYDVAADRLCALGHHPTPRRRYARILRELQGEITGVAAARAGLAAWAKVSPSSEEATVSVQGFGDVGRVLAGEMARQGARITGIADAEGFMRNPRGLDVEALVESRPGIVDRARLPPGTEEADRETWLEPTVDLLVPAAVPDAINWDNVSRVRAKIVVEAANIPVAEGVEAHLHRRGVFVLPDFVVNAGLAAAFGLLVTREWRRPQGLRKEVIRRIVGATREVVETAIETNRAPREVALGLARSRLIPP